MVTGSQHCGTQIKGQCAVDIVISTPTVFPDPPAKIADLFRIKMKVRNYLRCCNRFTGHFNEIFWKVMQNGKSRGVISLEDPSVGFIVAMNGVCAAIVFVSPGNIMRQMKVDQVSGAHSYAKNILKTPFRHISKDLITLSAFSKSARPSIRKCGACPMVFHTHNRPKTMDLQMYHYAKSLGINRREA